MEKYDSVFEQLSRTNCVRKPRLDCIQYTSIKYLDLTIHMNLNFDSHISTIAYKISKTIGLSLKSDNIYQKKHC